MADTFHPPADKNITSPARFLAWLVTSQPWRVAAGAGLGSLWMVGLAVPPYLLSRAIDGGLRTRDTGTLVGWTAALLAMGTFNAVVAMARHRTMTKVRMDASFRTVRAVMRQATALGDTLRRRLTTGEVVAIGVGDVQTIAQSMTVVGPGVGAVVCYGVVAALLLSISPLLAGIVLAGVPLLVGTVGPLQRRLRDADSGYRDRQGALTVMLVDVVSGLRVLNGLGGKDVYAARYRDLSGQVRDQGYRVGAVTSWVGALSGGLPALFLALVTWPAARMAAQGSIGIGDLVAVYGYAAVLVVPVAFLVMSGSEVARALVSARRVTDFLGLRHHHPEPGGMVAAPPGPAALHDPVSGVRVRPGAFTALAGGRPRDGAEVVERLGRFARSDAEWGGVPLGSIAPDRFRARVLVADNDAVLFSGTLREVVAGRYPVDDDAVRTAIRAAAATDIVQALPAGLHSEVTAGGRNLSGGQCQRLRLARAVYARPEILLAVEPTSAVDTHTEAAMAAGLRTARAGLTTLVTSVSPLVLEQADTVLHLVDGAVAASGTHHELLRTEPGYRALVSRAAEREEPPSAAEEEVAG